MIVTLKNYYKTILEIDEESCTGCGACVFLCPANIFEVQGDKVTIRGNGEGCGECGDCQEYCPEKVICLLS